MIKTPSIQTIFAKDTNGNYTRDALLYQDIFRYSIKELEPGAEYTFKLWELTEWLISTNEEIANDYKNPSNSHMTRTNKIQARIARVKRHLEVLQYLGLINEFTRTKESKGEGMTVVYSYTEFGLIVALLILTTSPAKRQKAIRFLYKRFCNNFESNTSSLDSFCLSFTDKLYKNNLFDKYVDTLLQTATNNGHIEDINQFFGNSLILDLNEEDSKRYFKLKNEAFDDLSRDMKKYFMHRQKLQIEAKMFGVSKNIKAFEKLAFDIRNDYKKIATEGYCQYCKLYFAIGLSLIEYLNQVHYVDQQTVTCPVCKKEKSIIIPSFRV